MQNLTTQPATERAAPAPPALLTDAERAVRLRTMRRWATGLLLFMTALFLVTEVLRSRLPDWVRLVNAFAEAAMVGALADWFAVTALFRRPLGLPIPHTAIIPEKKERIGGSLGRFVQQNFLSPDVISQRLDQLDLAERLQRWLAEPANSRMLAERITRLIPPLLERLDQDEVEAMIGRNVEDQLRKVNAAPLAGQLLTVLTSQNKHQELLDEGLRWAERTFEVRKPQIRQLIRRESPWYLRIVDRQLFEKIVDFVERTLADINADPQHPLREEVSDAFRDFIDRLKHSEDMSARVEAAKAEMLAHPTVRAYFQELWAEIRQQLQQDVAGGAFADRIERLLRHLGERLLEDAALREQLNATVRKTTLGILDSQRENVGRLIQETVAKWDTRTITEKLELQVGRDLQFIRINGTLVGGLVGLLLYLLRSVL